MKFTVGTKFIFALISCLIFCGTNADANTGARRILLLGKIKVSGGSYAGPLDAVSGATACYSLRACSASYATGSNNAITVTRASDSTTSNIKILATGALDVASASTFCAATTCSITAIFDQTGHGNTLTGTGAAAPALTFNCLGSLPCISFSAAALQQLSTATFSTIAQPNTFSFVAERTANLAAINSVLGFNSTTQLGWNAVADTGFIYSGSLVSVTGMTDNVLHSLQAVTNGASSSTNLDGSLVSSLSAGTSGIIQPFALGSNGNPSAGQFLQGILTEAIVYGGTSMSPANQNLICHSQRAYWGSAGSC